MPRVVFVYFSSFLLSVILNLHNITAKEPIIQGMTRAATAGLKAAQDLTLRAKAVPVTAKLMNRPRARPPRWDFSCVWAVCSSLAGILGFKSRKDQYLLKLLKNPKPNSLWGHFEDGQFC